MKHNHNHLKNLFEYCKNYGGFSGGNYLCYRGKDVDKLAEKTSKVTHKIPCKKGGPDCDYREWHNEESVGEIIKEEMFIERRIVRAIMVRFAASTHLDVLFGEGVGGVKSTMVCPRCSSDCEVERHRNGHLWIFCSNKDCVRIIE